MKFHGMQSHGCLTGVLCACLQKSTTGVYTATGNRKGIVRYKRKALVSNFRSIDKRICSYIDAIDLFRVVGMRFFGLAHPALISVHPLL